MGSSLLQRLCESDLFSGHKIPFMEAPLPMFRGLRVTPLVGQHADFLWEEVQQLLLKRGNRGDPNRAAARRVLLHLFPRSQKERRTQTYSESSSVKQVAGRSLFQVGVPPQHLSSASSGQLAFMPPFSRSSASISGFLSRAGPSSTRSFPSGFRLHQGCSPRC